MTFAVIDIIFVLIILFCIIHATMKGFIAEFFSKAAVIVGGLCAILFYKTLLPFINKNLQIEIFTEIVSFLSIFIIVYMIMKLVQHLLASLFQTETMSGLDKALGFFLGILEGLLITAFILIVLHSQPFFEIDAIVQKSIFDDLLSPFLTNPIKMVSDFVNNQ